MRQDNNVARFAALVIILPGVFDCSVAHSKPRDAAPNMVIILVDDLGWGAVGYHADWAETPHIDRFVKQGIELNRFYVAPMCSPTRAGLLTGRYPIRYGLARAVVPPYRNFGLSTREQTLPEMLASAGFQHRGAFGKWHLGHHHVKWHPLSRGFTHFEGHYNGAIDYFDQTREGERDWHVNYEPVAKTGYATDMIADAAGRFIRESAKGENPYLCYIAFNAPHSPFQAKPKHVKRFAKDNNPTAEHKLKAMIWSLDENIGKVLQAIDDTGEVDDTLVWFMSDNGGVRRFKRNNLPLRGAKLTTFEGGLRVPAAIRWPSAWKGGRKFDSHIGYIDVTPTLTAIAGNSSAGISKKLPSDSLRYRPDGVALQWAGNQRPPDRDWFSYHGQGGPETETISIHSGGWKLVVNGPDIRRGPPGPKHKVFLFHLAKDPNEKVNLSEQQPDMVKALYRKLVQHRQLQPKNAVVAYGKGRQGFKPWKAWRIPGR